MTLDRWPEPVTEALTLRLERDVVVLGLNPRLPLDEGALRFAAQTAHEISTGLEGVARLTRERAVARAIADAEREVLSGVFELAPAFMAVLRGPGHVYELSNPAYDRLVGHRRVLGRTVRQALPELEGQGFFELLDQVFTTGVPFVGNEVPIRLQPVPSAPIEPRYLNFVYQTMRGADGAVAGILVTGVDVTALVEARQIVERALAETERIARERDAEGRQLRTVLEQAPLAITITGPTGEIRFANAAFERLFALPAGVTRAQRAAIYTGYHLDGRALARGRLAWRSRGGPGRDGGRRGDPGGAPGPGRSAASPCGSAPRRCATPRAGSRGRS